MSGATQGMIKDTLESGRTREVAAVLTLARLPKVKHDFETCGDTLSVLKNIAETPSLILRRPWFGYDSIAFDKDVEGTQKKLFIAEREAAQIYELLQTNPTQAVNRARAEHISDDDVRAALDDQALKFIDLDLTKGEPQETIQTQLPFDRLKKFLTRAFKATQANGSAQLLSVRVAHAPRLQNSVAKVRELLEMDLGGIDLDPRLQALEPGQ